jgi:hypothetical protein
MAGGTIAAAAAAGLFFAAAPFFFAAAFGAIARPHSAALLLLLLRAARRATQKTQRLKRLRVFESSSLLVFESFLDGFKDSKTQRLKDSGGLGECARRNTHLF